MDLYDWNGIHQKSSIAIEEALKSYMAGTRDKAGYSQNKMIKQYGLDSKWSGGVCLALSSHWIRFHHQHKGSTATRVGVDGILRSKGALVAAANIQGVYRRQGKTTEISKAVSMNGLTVMAPNAPVRYLATDSFQELIDKVNRTHKYYILALSIPFGGSGHAICCYKSGGKFGYYSHLYVFDPNLAEFKVPASEIYLFFAVLHAYYQKNHGRNWWSITPLEVRP